MLLKVAFLSWLFTFLVVLCSLLVCICNANIRYNRRRSNQRQRNDSFDLESHHVRVNISGLVRPEKNSTFWHFCRTFSNKIEKNHEFFKHNLKKHAIFTKSSKKFLKTQARELNFRHFQKSMDLCKVH